VQRVHSILDQKVKEKVKEFLECMFRRVRKIRKSTEDACLEG